MTNHRLPALVVVLVAGLLALAFSSSPAVADDPPLIDPTLNPSVGGNPNLPPPLPTVASPEDWELLVALILLSNPNLTYSEIVAIALSQYNVLPPSYWP